eukprot:tig00000663_g2995.t1
MAEGKRASALAELELRYAAGASPKPGGASPAAAKGSAKKSSEKKRKQREVADEIDPDDPLYQRLDVPLDPPAPPPAADSQAGDVVATLVRSVAGPSAARGRQFENAVQQKLSETSTLLLDNPKQDLSLQDLRKRKAAMQAQRVKRVSAKQQRKLKVYDIPEESKKGGAVIGATAKVRVVDRSSRWYELYVPLHHLWTKYIGDVLGPGPPSGPQALNSLLKADFHGCRMRVVKSKCPSLVGIEGIMLQETEHTFRIITPADRIAVVPKVASVFAVRLSPTHEALLYGVHLRHRTAERSVKKFKNKVTVDL